MDLPADDFILLSLVNMNLRDKYASFREFCEEEQADGDEIQARLNKLGYEYDEARNAFK